MIQTVTFSWAFQQSFFFQQWFWDFDSSGHISFLGLYYFFPAIFFSFSKSTTIPNNLPFFFFLERTCQISMYSNLPTLKIHIHIYSIKPTKYQCKIHIHIYRCILPNISVFNLPTLIIHTHTHTHTYIEPAKFFIFFIFLRKNLSNINLLKLANFKNPHTYIYMQLAKYQCT